MLVQDVELDEPVVVPRHEHRRRSVLVQNGSEAVAVKGPKRTRRKQQVFDQVPAEYLPLL